MSSKEILVWLALGKENIRIGKLWCDYRKGKETSSFEYAKDWLEHPERFALEPALPLNQGTFHTLEGRNIFGAIGDSAPDRWGRVLMRRAESISAKNQNTQPRTLLEIDYLLGVNDEARQGALRFSINHNNRSFAKPAYDRQMLEAPHRRTGAYPSVREDLRSGVTTQLPSEVGFSKRSIEKVSIPPLIYLPKLLSATERFIAEDENAEDLKLLLAPGSSLGGARPKASVRDKDGNLAIAKFPKKDDEYNIVMWEAVALTLAEKSGIRVPRWRLENTLEKPVLIVQRFDRENDLRIPFISAMSMLEAQDNEQHSYLEIAYALSQNGGEPEKDMAELWRRIVFTIMISNTDDHLRNHGFIYERYKGWRLSPVYDINPTPLEIKSRVLSTAIDFDNTEASLEIALSVIKEFRLSIGKAKEIIDEVKDAVKQWRDVASALGIKPRECDFMASAFELYS